MPKEETKTEPVIQCRWCDQTTERPGHIVVNGEVKQCPSIDMVIQDITFP